MQVLYEVSTTFKRPLSTKCQLRVCLSSSNNNATSIENNHIYKKTKRETTRLPLTHPSATSSYI